MNRALSLGYSPCPNDTFIFFGIAGEKVSAAPYSFDIVISDVEELNRKAGRGALDVTKVSIFALLHLLDEYWLLRAGGALGRGCGPLVVARRPCSMEDLRDAAVAIPGKLTTAHLLLQLQGSHGGPRVEMSFEQIMPAVARGDVDAGVIIHEGRFTYPAHGLHLVLDLGAWWESRTGLPLPLGGIIMKRSLGLEAARTVESAIRDSLLHARSHPGEAWPYIRTHAQEMDPAVIERHIDTFVNDFSLDVGDEGERAVRTLLEAAFELAGKPFPGVSIFPAAGAAR